MNKIILLGLLLLCMPIVFAQFPICQSTVEIDTNCTMPTPVLQNCTTFNYTIFDLSGTVVDTDNLTVLAGDIFKFNFTQPAGSYIVELCEGSTREVLVAEDEVKLTFLLIILFGLGIALLLLPALVRQNMFYLFAAAWWIIAPLSMRQSLIQANLDFPVFYVLIGLGTLVLGIIVMMRAADDDKVTGVDEHGLQ